GHHETGGQVTNYEKHLENAFAFYNKLGIRAVKTGYAGGIIPKGEFHHGQFMVRHYRKVLETAVDYQIMINAHEPIKPTGIRRTYPNMMTREGVRGMEWNAWSDGNKPEHTTIIPFTRGLGGPIDYTPGIFDITFKAYKDKEKVHSTLANQLALYVILYSPIQMAADLPENYEGNPAFQFIKDVPVNWDQLQVISAEIGDYVSIARRSGEDWFIGCITDENEREVEIPLTFLNQDVGYSANIYVDALDADFETNPTAINVFNQNVDNKTILKFNLSRGGGCAISIKPTGN
ncbi:MAG: glycoside hydrolase family 97 catalytic domain-containing protein, partial [Melioribacteraceae bacterium]|nr:glycoside hydrolase family 97 catalytic domain-containing protein [Melioribacteraceae bacterium]